METPRWNSDTGRLPREYSAAEILWATLIFGFVVCVVLFLIARYLQDVPDGEPVNTDLVKLLFDLSKAGALLAMGSGLGAVVGHSVKRILDRREREQRTDQRRFLFNTLDELKSAYDTVESARLFIVSHKSAKTYTEQIGRMPDVLASLRSVERALITDQRGLPLREDLQSHLTYCIGFVERVLAEYMVRYPEVARAQTKFEDDYKVTLEKAKKERTPYPLKISPALKSVTCFGDIYASEDDRLPKASGEIDMFFETIKVASQVLRDEIMRLADPQGGEIQSDRRSDT